MWKAIVSGIGSVFGSIVGAITANASHIAWLLRQGVGWVVAMLILHWVGTNMILPMQAAHIQAVDTLSKDIPKIMNEQTSILQELRDAVRIRNDRQP